MFLSQSIFIAQNAGTSLTIHNQQNGKFECGLAKKSSQIREKRAQIGQVALIKLAFLISSSQILKTYSRLFEDEWCTCKLSLK